MNETKRTTRKKVTERVVVVNLAEMGPRPEWADVVSVLGGLDDRVVNVLMHWLTMHLGAARAEHENDPLAPASFRDHCSGRATTAALMLAEVRALRQPGKAAACAQMREYFGGGAKEQG